MGASVVTAQLPHNFLLVLLFWSLIQTLIIQGEIPSSSLATSVRHIPSSHTSMMAAMTGPGFLSFRGGVWGGPHHQGGGGGAGGMPLSDITPQYITLLLNGQESPCDDSDSEEDQAASSSSSNISSGGAPSPCILALPRTPQPWWCYYRYPDSSTWASRLV